MGKKKTTKEERKRFEAEKAETLRIEMEKERQRQLEEDRKEKLKQLLEAKERQKREKQENKLRRIQLATSCEYFKKIHDEIDGIHKENQKQLEWDRYMRCNGIPIANDPGNLRKYIHMWQFEIDQFNKNEHNWLLTTDERTILTQDREIVNVTRIHLQKQQPILGDLYVKRARDVLGILDDIDETIETNPYGLKRSIIDELHRLKLEFRQKLAEYINDFSFKILSNIDRDMKLEGLLIATHFYECDIFKSYLWTKRDIPTPTTNEKERQKESKNYINIDFASLRVNLCLPPAVKCKKGAIRGMWLNFDHFSDCCPSYEMPSKSLHNLNLSQAAKIEWKKRNELEQQAPIDPKPKSGNLNNDGSTSFDTIELINTSIVDVDKLYLDYVTNIMKEDRSRNGPEALKLKEFEINLRKYRIIGGIYCMDYFEQPEQSVKLSSRTYMRTVTGPNELRRRLFFQYFRAPEPNPSGVRRLPEEAEAEMKTVEKGLSKLAYITITLPDEVIWFEPPTVCRWETIEETKISEKIENKTTDLTEQRSLKMMAKKRCRPEILIEDFDLLQIPSKIDINFIIEEIIVPRLPNGYTIAMSDIAPRRNKLAMDCPSNEKLEIKKPKPIQCARDFLIPTSSPRPLFPKLESKLKFKIIKPKTMVESTSNQPKYLFSKLIEDLDDIRNEQIPRINRVMDDVSDMESVSVPDEQDLDPGDEQIQMDEMSFLKSDDFAWGLSKKPDTIKDTVESPSEESDDDMDELLNLMNSEADDKTDREKVIIGRWSTRDVHDPKFNEEKLALQFRAGRLGYFGLAVNWYANLPFQTWECKPDIKTPGSIFISLTAAVISIEITITEKGIILNSFQGGTSSLLQETSDKIMSFVELKHLLFRAGVNLFPDEDAFCYCDALCEKDFVTESHLYECMAQMGLTHNFMWSRWNNLQNSRTMVLLIRELIEKKKTPTFSTLIVTPSSAYLSECTEMSSSFSAVPLVEINGVRQTFHADLYHLGKEISQPISISKQNAMNPLLRDNFLHVLKSTRPLSLS